MGQESRGRTPDIIIVVQLYEREVLCVNVCVLTQNIYICVCVCVSLCLYLSLSCVVGGRQTKTRKSLRGKPFRVDYDSKTTRFKIPQRSFESSCSEGYSPWLDSGPYLHYFGEITF